MSTIHFTFYRIFALLLLSISDQLIFHLFACQYLDGYHLIQLWRGIVSLNGDHIGLFKPLYLQPFAVLLSVSLQSTCAQLETRI